MTRWLPVAVLLLALGAPARADDCQGVMAALSMAQGQVDIDIANIDALEAAITAPGWDPLADGWMVVALDDVLADLIGDLNTAAIAEARAHEAHCY